MRSSSPPRRHNAFARFYNVSQDFDDFRSFVASLQAAQNTLGSSGDDYTISDSVFKNHLFFFANPVLQLRVRAIPNFAHEHLKVDALINAMATTWSSLVAEDFTIPIPKSMLKSASTAPMPSTPAEAAFIVICRHLTPPGNRMLLASQKPYLMVIVRSSSHSNPRVTDFSNPNAGTITVIQPPGVVMSSCVLEGDSDNDGDDDY
ncbi:hypothetical protein EDB19DRAFT_2036013 [Suillus lakei]|nr:hypothetical protein EDB19DRAFT_2036013 [Suillus lakei]